MTTAASCRCRNCAAFDLRHLDGLIKPREAIWAIEDFYIDRELGAP
jgi:hypothetical protein